MTEMPTAGHERDMSSSFARCAGLLVLALAALPAAAQDDIRTPATTVVAPDKMPRIARVDERFQSYNVEMAELTGGAFWLPPRRVSHLTKPVSQMDTYDLLARGIHVENAPRKLPSHKADIHRMQDAGFNVEDCGPFIQVPVVAFKALERGDFDTISPGTDPQETNCRAYPTPDGGWLINRYGIRAEQEKPGWKEKTFDSL
jgi:hypothetical protein